MERDTQAALTQRGDWARLKQLMHDRLSESGWKDQVKDRCRVIAANTGASSITSSHLVREVTPFARAAVPDSIKIEILQSIRTILRNEANTADR